MANPILVGDKSKILSILKGLGETVDDIYDEADGAAACALAVALIREGKADFLADSFTAAGEVSHISYGLLHLKSDCVSVRLSSTARS